MRREATPFYQFGELAGRARAGDEAARERFFGEYLPERFRRFFQRQGLERNIVDVLTRRTLDRLPPSFLDSPTADNGRNPTLSLNWQVALTQRQTLSDYLDEHRPRIVDPQEEGQDIGVSLRQKLPELCETPLQLQVMTLRLGGLRTNDVASQLGLRDAIVVSDISQRVTAKRIEPYLKEAYGLERLGHWPGEEVRLFRAIRRGSLDGVKILKFWYTTPEAVEYYRKMPTVAPIIDGIKQIRDLNRLVTAAKTGNEEEVAEARRVLFEDYLPERARQYLAQNLPGDDIESLIRTALDKMRSGFEKYEHRPGRGKFTGWYKTILRNLVIDVLRRRKAQERINVERPQIVSQEELFPELLAVLPEILNGRADELQTQQQLKFVELRLFGASVKSIAEKLGLHPKLVQKRVTTALPLIRDWLEEKYRLKPVSSFDSPRLTGRARYGSIPAVQVLRNWYTTEEVVKFYKKQ